LAITLVDGQPRDGGKKGAHKGIDGIIYYQDDARNIDQASISVKGGESIHATHVRDLIGHEQQPRVLPHYGRISAFFLEMAARDFCS
jgi:hypothetical protein